MAKEMTRERRRITLGMAAAMRYANLTGGDIAEMLGISESTLSRWLAGQHTSPERQERFAEACDLTWPEVLEIGERELRTQELLDANRAVKELQSKPTLDAVLTALDHLSRADLRKVRHRVDDQLDLTVEVRPSPFTGK